MPTHASTMHKTGGFPPVLSILLACVGIVLAFIYRVSPISDVNRRKSTYINTKLKTHQLKSIKHLLEVFLGVVDTII